MLKKTFSRYWETVRDILYFCWKGDIPREMRRPRAPISLVARSSLTHLQHLSSFPQSDIANRHQSHFNSLLVWRLRVWLERCDWVCSPEVWLPGDWESSEAPPTSSLHQPPSPDHHLLPPSFLANFFYSISLFTMIYIVQLALLFLISLFLTSFPINPIHKCKIQLQKKKSGLKNGWKKCH